MRSDSGTGVLLPAKERWEVLGRLGGGETALPRRSDGGTDKRGWGGGTPPETNEAGPGTPGEDQGTWATETAMVTLAVTELEGGGTLSDTPDQQHGIPPLPSGERSRTSQDTAGKHHGGPPASDVDVVGGTREEGELAPWRRGEPQSGGQHRRRRRKRWSGQILQGGGGD